MHYERAPVSDGRSWMWRRLRSASLCRASLRYGGALSRDFDADLSIAGTLSERFRQVVAFPLQLLGYSSWEMRSGRNLLRRTVTSTAFEVTAPRTTKNSYR